MKAEKMPPEGFCLLPSLFRGDAAPGDDAVMAMATHITNGGAQLFEFDPWARTHACDGDFGSKHHTLPQMAS